MLKWRRQANIISIIVVECREQEPKGERGKKTNGHIEQPFGSKLSETNGKQHVD